MKNKHYFEDLDNKYKLIDCYKNGLLSDTIPFWINNCVDKKYGGFNFCLDRKGAVIDTDKGIWTQGRFTWILCNLYDQIEKNECPDCKSKDLTDARPFNLMFKTAIGPVDDGSSFAYLRPETCQQIFTNFKNIIDSTSRVVPFGIAQIGKAFRNEITTIRIKLNRKRP